MSRKKLVSAAATVAVALVALAGCGPKKAAVPEPLPPFIYHPGVKATDYFPLAAGASWTHAITRAGLGHPEEVLGVTRVVEVVAGRATITSPGGNFKYVIASDGIMKESLRTYVLREPIAPGTKWTTSGPEDFATIEKVDAVVTTRAGTFDKCILVREVTPGQELENTYCPRVGPVLIVHRATVGDAPAPLEVMRGELVAYSTPGASAGPELGKSETTLEKIER